MKIEIENINDKNIKLIREWIKQVLILVEKQILLKEATIKVKRAKNLENYKELNGIGGYCPSGDVVEIAVDESNPNFGYDAFSLTLTHELNHLARRQAGIKIGESTFRECLISEGLADYFCYQLFNKFPVWIKIQDKAAMKHYLKLAENIVNTRMSNKLYEIWFTHGSEEQAIPRWTGYNLGLYLVRQKIEKNKSPKMKELIKLPASEF